MTTIKDIAQLAGVSVTTVSKVINNYPDIGDKTKQRVMKIMQQQAYEPNAIAKSLSSKKSHSIGLFLNYNPIDGLHHAFFQGVLFGLEKMLGQKGYGLIYFSDVKWREDKNFLQKARNRNVDGAVFLGLSAEDPRLKNLRESDLPTVFIDGEHSGQRTACVLWDSESGARQVVEHFYQLGHRELGMITGVPELHPTIERTTGFLATAQRLGIEPDLQWIVDGGDFTEQAGYRGMQQLLTLAHPPTAVFCQSDSIAVGALQALEEAGLICPNDMSIVGFDDISLCRYIRPMLTTVKQDTVLMGEVAGEVLLNLIGNEPVPKEPVVLPVELVSRASCLAREIS